MEIREVERALSFPRNAEKMTSQVGLSSLRFSEGLPTHVVGYGRRSASVCWR